MKLSSIRALILILISSLVCSPVSAITNRDDTIEPIIKINIDSGIQQNAKQEGILIGQATKKRKGLLQRWFNRKNSTGKKRQGFFNQFNRRKPKVQQKQKRQGFLSRFRLKRNRNQQSKNQKRSFLQFFGIGRT